MTPKISMTVAGAVAALWLGGALAAGPDPFLGSWELDMSTAPPPAPAAGPPAKGLTLTLTDAGGGKQSAAVVILLADGKTVEQPARTYVADGSTPITDSPQFDHVVTSHPDANTQVSTSYKGDKAVQTVTAKLSAGGTRLTQDIEATGPDGKPVHLTLIYNRKK